MEKLKLAFCNLTLAVSILSAGACASAGIDKSIPSKLVYELGDVPVIDGGAFRVSITVPEEPKEIFGTFQGKVVDFFPDGQNRYSAFVGVLYGTHPGNVPMVVKMKLPSTKADEYVEQQVDVVVRAGKYPSEKLSVPPRTVTPNPKDKKQIARDQAYLARAYAVKTQQKFWDPPFVMPVDKDRGTSSVFGTSRVYNGIKQNVHYGTDLRAPTGTPIGAPLSGRVAVAKKLFFTGYTVILDHGYGLFTIYGHMSKLKVKENQVVKKGTILGLSGMTGRASGPHLHWGVNLHGVKVDPFVLMQTIADSGERAAPVK
jgi:hypothetical protein